jgi:hypothetical protein
MKQSIQLYGIILSASILSVLIPLWISPFLVSMITTSSFKIELRSSLRSHFIIYTGVCIMFCLYAYNTGSKVLVSMIGEIFQGVSFWVLLLLSSIIYGINALLGAWLGYSLRKWTSNH